MVAVTIKDHLPLHKAARSLCVRPRTSSPFSPSHGPRPSATGWGERTTRHNCWSTYIYITLFQLEKKLNIYLAFCSRHLKGNTYTLNKNPADGMFVQLRGSSNIFIRPEGLTLALWGRATHKWVAAQISTLTQMPNLIPNLNELVKIYQKLNNNNKKKP